MFIFSDSFLNELDSLCTRVRVSGDGFPLFGYRIFYLPVSRNNQYCLENTLGIEKFRISCAALICVLVLPLTYVAIVLHFPCVKSAPISDRILGKF